MATIVDLLGSYLGSGGDNLVSRPDEQADDARAQMRVEPGPHFFRGYDSLVAGIVWFHLCTSGKSELATGGRVVRRRVAS